LSTQRNTTLPHPDHVDAPAVQDEEHLKHLGEPQHVGIGTKIKGQVNVIEGKVLHKKRLAEEGRAIKQGISLEGK